MHSTTVDSAWAPDQDPETHYSPGWNTGIGFHPNGMNICLLFKGGHGYVYITGRCSVHKQSAVSIYPLSKDALAQGMAIKAFHKPVRLVVLT